VVLEDVGAKRSKRGERVRKLLGTIEDGDRLRRYDKTRRHPSCQGFILGGPDPNIHGLRGGGSREVNCGKRAAMWSPSGAKREKNAAA